MNAECGMMNKKTSWMMKGALLSFVIHRSAFIVSSGGVMVSKKAQSKAGIPARRRGQQMGDERSNPNKQAEAEASTPALSGRRKVASKMYGDESSKQIASDAAGPSSTSPSVPAAVPTGEPLGQSGGERVFKKRQGEKAKRGKG